MSDDADGTSLSVQRSVELPANEDSRECDEVGNDVTVVTLSAIKAQETVSGSTSTPPTDDTSDPPSTCCPADEATSSRGSRKTYLVRFEGNNSKKWDGHDVELDGEWLESLYDVSELQIPGKHLSLPWPGKGRQIRHWNAVISTPRDRSTESDPAGGEKSSTGPSQVKKLPKVQAKAKAKAKTRASPKKRSRRCKSLSLSLTQTSL